MSTQREIKFRCWHPGHVGRVRVPASMFYDTWSGECLKFLKEGQPVVVMQYTGLRDKEGHEVYDGDLPGGIWEEHRVQWCHKCHGWSLGLVEVEGHCGQCDGDYMWLDFVDDVNEGKTTIIGNIHEHPSLIP